MGGKTKSLCKWKSSQYEKDLDKLRRLVKAPTHICKSCGRAVNDRRQLCKPIKL